MSAALPIVGVTTYVARASWGPFSDARVALVPDGYYELVAAAGARPVLIPAPTRLDGGPAAGTRGLIATLDALVLIGGTDVGPSHYGQDPDEHLGRIDAPRDTSELALVEEALRVDLPLLAICRGHQVLNVALGGSLIQHVPDVIGTDEHQPRPGTFFEHEIATFPGTETARIFGARPVVACSHHQAIDALAPGLVVTAQSIESYGTTPLIEAVEHEASSFCLGVQWHPEQTDDVRPFRALVDAI